MSSAAAHGASSDAARDARADEAHGASADAAAGQVIVLAPVAPVSVSNRVTRALVDPRGGRIIQDWAAPLREVVRPILRAIGSQQRALVVDELLNGIAQQSMASWRQTWRTRTIASLWRKVPKP